MTGRNTGQKDKRTLIRNNEAKHLSSVYDVYKFVENEEQSLW